MKAKSNWIELSALCGLFLLLSVWGIVWDITSGLLTSGIDGIMLLFICLMMGGIFSLMLVAMLWQAGLIPLFRKAEVKADAKPAATTKAATPAPAASPAPPTSPAAPAPTATPAQKASQPVQSTPTTK